MLFHVKEFKEVKHLVTKIVCKENFNYLQIFKEHFLLSYFLQLS